MPVKNEKDLNDQLRGFWLKAMSAIELRNLGYAIELLQNLLRQEPEFLTARQVLRRAEVARTKGKKKGFFSISTAPLAIMKAQRELKKDPRKALELIEEVLETNPYNPQANLLLKEAAIAGNYPEIAIFALETLLEKEPKDVNILHQLGQLYHQYEQSDRAVEVYNRIAEIDPLDLKAVKLGKDASARASMQKGGWTEADSYRDLIKDKVVALSLEQHNRMPLCGDLLEQRISELFKEHEAEPENIDLAKRLGALHDQKDDLEGAIAWYRYAVSLTNKSDRGLVKKISDLQIRQLDRQIRENECDLAQTAPEHPDFAARSEQLAQARRQRVEILIEDARKRIDRNPTDLRLRFELGEHLTNAGQYREALFELQRARQNPNARLKAVNLLGHCYRELGMLDLAASELEGGASEQLAMDQTKKEILYNLGLVYERMGNHAQSIAVMKQIYENDCRYRDVAQRVEAFYRATLENK